MPSDTHLQCSGQNSLSKVDGQLSIEKHWRCNVECLYNPGFVVNTIYGRVVD